MAGAAATLHATLRAEETLRRRWSAAHAADPAANRATLCDVEYMSCPPMAHAAALLGERDTAGAPPSPPAPAIHTRPPAVVSAWASLDAPPMARRQASC